MACDYLCASVNRSAKPATAGPKRPLGEIGGIKEGDLVCVLDFRQRELQVAHEHHQAGHGPPYRLGGGLGGAQ